ncbi:MAG: DUF1598 domain-containing protein [Planctomycetaceae bacterium]|nr:DUF1598 domain-containing protein [Planctomycetaceae bacterium]
MHIGKIWAALAVALAAGLLVPPVHAQNNQNNQGNNQNNGSNIIGTLPAGVLVSPEGVLRVKQFADKTGQLAKLRAAEARVKLGANLARPSELRKVSLTRLEAAMAQRLAAGQAPTDEMKNLAGLTRLQYVFYYPDSKEIVVAGPAEGFMADGAGRMVGVNSGRAVLELQDLVAALRAFPPAGKETHLISVSIDPTAEGLAAMQKWLVEISGKVRPGDANAIVEGLRQKLGLHNVTVAGVSPRTHFAQVLVEADYRMKLIGIGIEQPPVKMATYVSRANPTDVSRNALQRWYFTPNYDCVRVTEDALAMELVGQGVKLIGAHELVNADGGRVAAAAGSQASELYCKAFTELYPQIAQRSPVYAQLRNLIDMSVAAAFIQKQDYYGQSGWKAEVLLDEEQYPIETYEAPKTVETACTAIWKGSRLMTPVGGGVRIEPTSALKSSNLLKDEEGMVKAAHGQIKLEGLTENQWWWD